MVFLSLTPTDIEWGLMNRVLADIGFLDDAGTTSETVLSFKRPQHPHTISLGSAK
jgi:hypothetical protein